MKHLLKEGTITYIDRGTLGGSLSGEAHLLTHKGKKFIVRRCSSMERAKNYVALSKTYAPYTFLPKLLGRYGKDVLYEFIEGRDLRGKESLKVFEKIGRIVAAVSTVNVKGSYDSRFKRQLEELVRGTFSYNPKIILKRARIQNWKQPGPFYTKQKAKRIENLYNHLKDLARPSMALDANDVTPGNFRLDKKGKVYFVDVEAIKPRFVGMGIAKCFLKWAKTPQKKKAFLKGYATISDTSFLTQDYLNYCYLCFAMQAVNYNVNVYQKKDSARFSIIIDNLLKEYGK